MDLRVNLKKGLFKVNPMSWAEINLVGYNMINLAQDPDCVPGMRINCLSQVRRHSNSPKQIDNLASM